MIIYHFLALWTFLSALFTYNAVWNYEKHNIVTIAKRKSTINYFAIVAMIFTIIAFRASYIGADTSNYLGKFNTIRLSDSYASYNVRAAIEPLFYYLNKTLGQLADWSQAIIIAEAIIVVAGYSYCFKRYSGDVYLSLLAFVSLGPFLSSLCLLRQAIAMAICVFGLKFAFEKKPNKFFLITFTATLIHYTALFFCIAYLVCGIMKCKKRNTFVLMVCSLLGVFFVTRLQSVVSTWFDRWGNYYNIETGAQGYISFVVFLLITIIVEHEKKYILETTNYAHAIINLNYIHMGIWGMRLFTRNAERIALYFTIAPILLLSLIMKAIIKHYGKSVALIIRFLVIICLLVFFIYKFSYDASYYPYRFVWEQ